VPDTPKHILVINDTPSILDLFQELLGEEGYRVTVDIFDVPSREKLDHIKALRPDLIILDFIVGGESLGWQLLQLLKMDRETVSIPVVVCTGAVRQVTELQGHLTVMGVGIVLKPFDIDQLLAEVAASLARAGSVTGGERSAREE
jgi:DNA-binding response OmpR family regulator